MKESVVAADDVTMEDVEIEDMKSVEVEAEVAEHEEGAVSTSKMEPVLEHVRSVGRQHRADLEQRFSEQAQAEKDLPDDANGDSNVAKEDLSAADHHNSADAA